MNYRYVFGAILLAAACSRRTQVPQQTPTPSSGSDLTTIPPIAREFRAVWVATVANIDWPSRPGLPADQQKQELIAILDKVRAMRMNAVILQIRPAGDALYDSKLEPWSEYLTGKMGAPPVPYYDPLTFAVAEAHKRGLELHAWFNPYRAHHPSAFSPISEKHLSRTRPDIVRPYGKHLWMDPGEPDVIKHSLAVINDVVKRYDIDGIHIDDYFYPYKENDASGKVIDFPDSISYARYLAAGGKLARDDWRRSNVDNFVEQMYKQTKATKPWVKFGISPFGFWRPNNPVGTRGLDAYEHLYADSKKWLNKGWLDYWTPQLYWQIDDTLHGYTQLLDWWNTQNTKRRHMWPGNAPYRWSGTEMVQQIGVTRKVAGGNVYFSMKTFMNNRGGAVDSIMKYSYTYFALPPATPWLDNTAPHAPRVTVDSATRTLNISPAAGEQPMWYGIRMRIGGQWFAEVIPAAQSSYQLRTAPGESLDAVVVTAFDRSGNESKIVALRSDLLALLDLN